MSVQSRLGKVWQEDSHAGVPADKKEQTLPTCHLEESHKLNVEPKSKGAPSRWFRLYKISKEQLIYRERHQNSGYSGGSWPKGAWEGLLRGWSCSFCENVSSCAVKACAPLYKYIDIYRYILDFIRKFTLRKNNKFEVTQQEKLKWAESSLKVYTLGGNKNPRGLLTKLIPPGQAVAH